MYIFYTDTPSSTQNYFNKISDSSFLISTHKQEYAIINIVSKLFTFYKYSFYVQYLYDDRILKLRGKQVPILKIRTNIEVKRSVKTTL